MSFFFFFFFLTGEVNQENPQIVPPHDECGMKERVFLMRERKKLRDEGEGGVLLATAQLKAFPRPLPNQQRALNKLPTEL